MGVGGQLFYHFVLFVQYFPLCNAYVVCVCGNLLCRKFNSDHGTEKNANHRAGAVSPNRDNFVFIHWKRFECRQDLAKIDTFSLQAVCSNSFVHI